MAMTRDIIYFDWLRKIIIFAGYFQDTWWRVRKYDIFFWLYILITAESTNINVYFIGNDRVIEVKEDVWNCCKLITNL